MSQSRGGELAGMEILKKTNDTCKETTNQMTGMIKNVILKPNLYLHLCVVA